LVPSLGYNPDWALLGVVFRFQSQSQLGTSFGVSFSSSCGTDPGIEPESVPVRGLVCVSVSVLGIRIVIEYF
jgi:hypothetical protein